MFKENREVIKMKDMYTVYLWKHVKNKMSLMPFPWMHLNKDDAVIIGRFNSFCDVAACVNSHENAKSVCGIWKVDDTGEGRWFD